MEQCGLKLRGARERGTVEERARRINWRIAFHGSPAADCIVVFHRESDRVRESMTVRTNGICAMLGETLAYREGWPDRFGLGQRGDVGRRRRWRHAKHVLEDPLAADHG